MIFFDNASTTKPSESVLEVFTKISLNNYGNPSSPHDFGHESERLIEKSKNIIFKYLNLNPKEYSIIFTSGATESNNLFLKGFLDSNRIENTTIISSVFEHSSIKSVLNNLKEIKDKNINVVYLEPDSNGHLDLSKLDQIDKNKVSLVSVMSVSNETGAIFNLKELKSKLNDNTIIMSDVTQAMGKTDLDFSSLDCFSFSFHKICGLKGCGALVFKNKIKLSPIFFGGGQQQNLRSGTINVPSICANATALKEAITTYITRYKNVSKIFDYLVSELQKLSDDIVINTPLEGSTKFILNFSFTKLKASVVVENLSNQGIYVSTSSACSSKINSMSSAILHQTKDEFRANNTIRLSFIGNETQQDAEIFIKALKETIIKLKEVIK